MIHRLPGLASTFLLCSVLGWVAACGSEPPSREAPAVAEPVREAEAPGLLVEGAHAQLMGDMGAVYFKVVNEGSGPDRLVRVETPVAESAETHESSSEDGVVRMRARPDGFEIPADGVLTLEPGGKHVMLMGLEATATASGRLPLTLVFEHAPPIDIEVEVGAPDTADADHDRG
ncbi:MAG: copper chaperone PCu(A)C [Acidobacteria bacterium]|nr:copper chaperone PCu(A)C [Acidobacteriota bacterium]